MSNLLIKRLNNTVLFFLFIILLIYTFCFTITKIDNEDIWWHLKAGEYIVKNLSIPHTDIFSYTIYGKEWITYEWLSEVIFYLIYYIFGFNGLILLQSIIIILYITIIFWEHFKIDNQINFIFIIIPTVFFISWHVYVVRPHIFSLLYLSIFYRIIILNENFKKHHYYMLLFFGIIWINSHAGFFIGLFLIFIKTLENLIFKKYFDKKLLVLFLIILFFSFVNPNTYKIYYYAYKLTQSKFFMKYVGEWSPLYSTINLEIARPLVVASTVWFIVSVIFLIFSFYKKYPQRYLYLVLFLTMIILSIKYRRNGPLLLIMTAPIILSNINKYFKRIKNIFSILIINTFILLIIILFLYDIFWNENKIIGFKIYQPGFGIRERYSDCPAKFLNKINFKGNIFNVHEYGGYLIWYYPQKKVFIDGRCIEYGEQHFKKYSELIEKLERFEHIVNENNIECFFLNQPVMTPHKQMLSSVIKLINKLIIDKDWRLIYWDDYVLIFLKNSLENRNIILKYGYTKVFPTDKKITFINDINHDDIVIKREIFRILENNPNCSAGYSFAGHYFKFKKDYKNSLHYFKKSLQLNYTYYTLNNIASIYADLNNFDLAEYYLLKSYKLHLENKITIENLCNLYKNTGENDKYLFYKKKLFYIK